MATYEVTSPDGRKFDVTAPDGASQEEVMAYAKQQFAKAQKTSEAEPTDERPELMRRMNNFSAGALRGAGSIGATLLTPVDAAARSMGFENALIGRRDRREAMDDALRMLGAETDSLAFGGGKLGAEVAGTAGLPLAAAKPLAGVAPRVAQAIQTAGFTKAPLPIRMAGGAASGMLTAGLVDPKSAAFGGSVGMALPLVGRVVSPAMEWMSRWLMQSALKPTIKQLKSGDADVAVETLLEKGISPTKGGVEKLQGLIGEKNREIKDAIGASTADVNKLAAARALSDAAQKFSRQVNPTEDLNAISNAGLDFLAHPSYPGMTMPVQAAQDLKQGTYKILAKKYGQVGTAETEAQKALARGLKEEIAAAVPAVRGLNAEETRLLTTLDVAERRALMELNKNPMGLSLLANNPGTWAAFMADRSSAFKALAARMINASNKGMQSAAPTIGRAVGAVAADEQ